MPDIGVPELIIVFVIVLLLLGPGKAADLGSSLGKGIREFRRATKEDDEHPALPIVSVVEPSPASVVEAAPNSAPPAPAKVRFCTDCGIQNRDDAKFCIKCGQSTVAAV